MNSIFALFAPVALVIPSMVGDGTPASGDARSAAAADGPQSVVGEPGLGAALDATAAPSFRAIASSFRPKVQRQVRIEQRIIIRISPARPTATRNDLLAALPQGVSPARFEQRRMGRCIPIGAIAGVRADPGNRLILYMRDRQMVSATLEKACRAADFYSGFYVERNGDGQICAGRDTVQARNGAKCEVSALHRLVPADD